ncbi:hypothetical protein Kfla_3010 [Kribbella flavida DSM 17836]|uniref:DUF6458 domain-containing protein n=1 Tax=Kribbella flavida (strain DSM 17836 / JCM 10339 / NBRC 14399) TaxID=479435 RepID=D2Q1T5_KRIFD|nr:DUF6458 family protein [Kribbella flavida]ADB32074.1 hypothetical protein Kfla_3010 [Kribbella flavida DSM 17836]
MRISVGIFLIAVGGIVAFGIRDTSGPVDFTVVGVVIMLAGVAGTWLSYAVANKGRTDESLVIRPDVEQQYRTDPQSSPLSHQIDVTPTEYRERH